ncbi:MAG: hypothetical protein AB7I27_09725 [Bacteriovoracaceae bacterium]
MFDSLINYLDKFGPEVLVIQFGFLVIISTLFLWLWFSNRRKYHNLKHAIPANVVKNYLDSIIQNSTALKSSLFRGGGLDTNATGSVPSVMPLHNLLGGENIAVSGAPSTALLEELNQKKAQLAALEAQLSSSLNAQKELEAKLNQSQSALAAAQAKIKELEALLAQKREAGGAVGDAALKAELDMVIKERDEIRERLKEFEIISDDLANLKRLQQENAQLKRSLAAQGGQPIVEEEAAPSKSAAVENISADQSTDAAAEAPFDASSINPDQPVAISQNDVNELLEDFNKNNEAAATPADNQALEDFLSAPTESASEPAATEEPAGNQEEVSASSESGDNKSKSDKTPEDLLSEFEKMLG